MPAKQQSRVTGKLDYSTKAALGLGPGPVSLPIKKELSYRTAFCLCYGIRTKPDMRHRKIARMMKNYARKT